MLETRQPFVGQTHPTTVLLSVHKGASTFLAHDLAKAMTRVFSGLEHLPFHQMLQRGTPVEDLAVPPTGVLVSRVYPPHYDMLVEDPVPPTGRFADKKLVLLRRDPRDVAVSLYYSLAYSHSEPPVDKEGFTARREALRSMDITDAIREDTARPAIRQFRTTIDFLERFPHTCLTTYETLIGDFPAWMRQVAEYLEWTDEEAEAVSRGLEESVKPPDEVDPYQHKRRMTPGNWREVFDHRLRKIFERRIGPELEAAGYGW